ncbi:hypothetical protein, conserved [Eimeria tenella]|uniref:Uncharacterized protein n=1 Tax=Eimeria tenella TaxID=5802 RepID=U6KSB0_EIMTE|nr:hypothetical protein, conserved [Eimeria tenella]CDJ40861.1 hypothetical protein, conserved [Eimeria tenella]|eukprot:XP_013231611.1 hypothetical protein, conserved [Eimeria tenella]
MAASFPVEAAATVDTPGGEPEVYPLSAASADPESLDEEVEAPKGISLSGDVYKLAEDDLKSHRRRRWGLRSVALKGFLALVVLTLLSFSIVDVKPPKAAAKWTPPALPRRSPAPPAAAAAAAPAAAAPAPGAAAPAPAPAPAPAALAAAAAAGEEFPPFPDPEGSVEYYQESFLSAADQLEGLWERASPAAAKALAVPTEPRELPLYKLNLLLMEGLCSGAAEVLKALGDMEQLHEATGVPVGLLGTGSEAELEALAAPGADQTSGHSLDQLLQDLGVRSRAFPREKVPRRLAQLVENLVNLNFMVRDCYFRTFAKFRPFLQVLGVDSEEEYPRVPPVPLLFAKEEFDAALFVLSTRGGFGYDLRSEEVLEKLVSSLGNNWNSESAFEFAKEQYYEIKFMIHSFANAKAANLRLSKWGPRGLDTSSVYALARFLL